MKNRTWSFLRCASPLVLAVCVITNCPLGDLAYGQARQEPGRSIGSVTTQGNLIVMTLNEGDQRRPIEHGGPFARRRGERGHYTAEPARVTAPSRPAKYARLTPPPRIPPSAQWSARVSAIPATDITDTDCPLGEFAWGQGRADDLLC